MSEEARSYDGIGRLLARLAALHPREAFALAGVAGALRNRVTGRWPSVAEVRALFPLLTPTDAATLAARIGALHERNRVLVHCVRRRGFDPLRPLLVVPRSFRSMEGPSILATFHVGALHAIGAALETLTVPVLSFRRGALAAPAGALESESTRGDEQSRAAALHRAHGHLRAGGIVVLALDEPPGEAIAVGCLGRTLRLAPGAFALSRWSGVPVRSIVARWGQDGIEVEHGDRLDTPDEAAEWLERYLTGRPSELTLGMLRSLLGVS